MDQPDFVRLAQAFRDMSDTVAACSNTMATELVKMDNLNALRDAAAMASILKKLDELKEGQAELKVEIRQEIREAQARSEANACARLRNSSALETDRLEPVTATATGVAPAGLPATFLQVCATGRIAARGGHVRPRPAG